MHARAHTHTQEHRVLVDISLVEVAELLEEDPGLGLAGLA